MSDNDDMYISISGLHKARTRGVPVGGTEGYIVRPEEYIVRTEEHMVIVGCRQENTLTQKHLQQKHEQHMGLPGAAAAFLLAQAPMRHCMPMATPPFPMHC